jgi:hypothetical protein
MKWTDHSSTHWGWTWGMGTRLWRREVGKNVTVAPNLNAKGKMKRRQPLTSWGRGRGADVVGLSQKSQSSDLSKNRWERHRWPWREGSEVRTQESMRQWCPSEVRTKESMR